jgi:hypothetical protein
MALRDVVRAYNPLLRAGSATTTVARRPTARMRRAAMKPSRRERSVFKAHLSMKAKKCCGVVSAALQFRNNAKIFAFHAEFR